MRNTTITTRLKKFPNWMMKRGQLVRHLNFPSYLAALKFVNRLGHAAERMNHHPDLLLQYKKLTITYSTHSAHGITSLDFQGAALVEKLRIRGQVWSSE